MLCLLAVAPGRFVEPVKDMAKTLTRLLKRNEKETFNIYQRINSKEPLAYSNSSLITLHEWLIPHVGIIFTIFIW